MQAEIHHASVVEERQFVCGACGLRRLVSVTGLGEGSSTFLNAEGTGADRARRAAAIDVEDTLALAVCPSCGHRRASASWWWWWKHALAPSLLVLAIMGFGAAAPWLFDVDMRDRDKEIAAWVVMGIGLSRSCWWSRCRHGWSGLRLALA